MQTNLSGNWYQKRLRFEYLGKDLLKLVVSSGFSRGNLPDGGTRGGDLVMLNGREWKMGREWKIFKCHLYGGNQRGSGELVEGP